MTDVSNQRVGFVGLGDQGGPMALANRGGGFPPSRLGQAATIL